MSAKHADIVSFITAQRIRWIGHFVRMDKEWTAKRRAEWISVTVRIGRLRLRWEDVGKIEDS